MSRRRGARRTWCIVEILASVCRVSWDRSYGHSPGEFRFFGTECGSVFLGCLVFRVMSTCDSIAPRVNSSYGINSSNRANAYQVGINSVSRRMAGRKPTISDDEILNIFEESSDPVLSTNEVADKIGLGRRGTYNRLDQLANKGKLRRKSIGPGYVWWVP